MYSWEAPKTCFAVLTCFLIATYTYTVECAERCDDEPEGQLRLEGFSSEYAGRVEICHNNEWGTICVEEERFADKWGEKNAHVVCRALGFSGALNAILHNTIPDINRVTDRSVPIHYSQVRCTGAQESLLDCDLSEITSQCTHDQDAAIVCRQNERAGHVRLIGDTRDEVGAVELYYPGIGWTGICADPDRASLWLDSDHASRIVCRQLGYRRGTPFVDPLDSTFIRNRSVTVTECNINKHFELTQCDTSILTSPCSNDNLAWVQCELGNNEYGDASKIGSEREGVVRLEFSGRRGHICDSGWDRIDAEVACVEFNLDNSRTDYDANPEGNHSRYISDLMPIWVTDVRCTTTEESDGDGGTVTVADENDVIDCRISDAFPVGYTDCNSHEFSRDRIALVDCGTALDRLLPLYIVMGIFGPFILIGLCVGAFYLFSCLFSCCASCLEDCNPCILCIMSWACISSTWNALCGCCKRTMRKLSTFSCARGSGHTETTQQTTTSRDVEMQSPGDIFYEPQGDEDVPPDTFNPPSTAPAKDTELTEQAPPGYTEATSYATVQDKVPPQYD